MEGAVQVQERTDPGQGDDEVSGHFAFEEKTSHEFACQQEKEGAGDSQGQAQGDCFPDSTGYLILVSGGLGLGNGGKEHDRNGIREDTWELDKRHGHAGEGSVDT